MEILKFKFDSCEYLRIDVAFKDICLQKKAKWRMDRFFTRYIFFRYLVKNIHFFFKSDVPFVFVNSQVCLILLKLLNIWNLVEEVFDLDAIADHIANQLYKLS